MKRSALLAVAAVSAGAVAAPATSIAQDAPDRNIVEIAASDDRFTTLVKLVKKAGLADDLASGELTVFAPTNKAFNKLPRKTLRAVKRDKDLLISVLTYHVVAGEVPASEVVKLDGKRVETLNGKTVRVRVNGSKVRVNRSKVTQTDIDATNGVVHVVNRVLVP
jgi:uncharacterized surface protein with fasciclin (FAS1) repeats